jgi:2,3-bisphosphoglycerate-independent phosphoglycerate mutase
VPFLLWREGGEQSGLSAFSEAQARSTGLVVESGHDFLSWVLHQAR